MWLQQLEKEEDAEDKSEKLTVELNSVVALPRNLEQSLDTKV